MCSNRSDIKSSANNITRFQLIVIQNHQSIIICPLLCLCVRVFDIRYI